MRNGGNDAKEKTRLLMLDLLEDRLADLRALGLRAEWDQVNLKEPSFIALGKLFDRVGNDSKLCAARIMERTVQLGGAARRTREALGEMEKSEGPSEYYSDFSSAQDQVGTLSRRLSDFRRRIQLSIESADEAKDGETADVFREIARGFDRYLWLADATGPSR
jgi:starvation-inducible DNA-binding protein